MARACLPPVVTPSGFLYTRQGTTFVLSATVSDAGLVNQTLVDTNHPQVGANLPLGAWNIDETTIGQTRAWQRSVGPVSSDGVFSATYRAADAAGHIGVSGSQVIVVDSVRPSLTVTQLAATAPYGWSALMPTPKVWYGLGMGVFTVTVDAGDALAGLDTLMWPATTSGGGPVVYGGAIGVTAQWTYSFTQASSFNQLAALMVRDRSGNGRVAGVQVLHDVTPPTVLALDAPIKTYGEPAILRWSAVDDGAGVRGYDLSVRVDGLTLTRVLTQSTATSYAAGVLDNTHFYEWQLVVWDNVNNPITRTATTAGVSATKTYYFGASRVAVREAGVLSFLHSDQLSSASASTDASGNVVGRQLFEPFGAVRATYGEVNGSWGWATHRKSEATGLTFMRARWYAPGVGRFVSPDSVVPGATDPQAFNRYSYSGNSPLSQIDPTGHGHDCWIFQAICDYFDPPAPPAPKITVTFSTPPPTQTSTPMASTSTPRPTPTSTPSPTAMPTSVASSGLSFSRMPIDQPGWTQGYGPTQFTQDNPDDYYGTSGLHGGIDLGAAEGTAVYAGLSGTVVDAGAVGLTRDAAPNVVIESNGYFILYGHVGGTLAIGTQVTPDTQIGTVLQHKRDDHLHLAVLTATAWNWRNYNPMAFFPPDSTIHALSWNSYVGTNYDVYSMQSFSYSTSNFWADKNDKAIDATWNSALP